MVVLDATIVNVALPHIQRALGFSGSGLEWVVNAYALAFGGLMLLGGRAGDLFGRRRVFIAGLVQGAGAAMIAPAALALITTTFPEGQPRNRAMGVYAAMSVARRDHRHRRDRRPGVRPVQRRHQPGRGLPLG